VATVQDNIVSDSSTLARFIAWAGNLGSVNNKGISYALGQFAFLQQAEPGQVQWADSASITLDSITGNGTIWTGTTHTAHGFRAGQIVTIAGTTHFNSNRVLLTASGTTFTITDATQSGVTDNAGGQTCIIKGITKIGDILRNNNATIQAVANAGLTVSWKGIFAGGTTYIIGDVVWFNTGTDYNVFISIANANTGNNPVGGAADTKWQAYCYEFWKSNDGGTAYHMKFEYGQAVANVPGMSFQLGTSISGTAALGGNVSFRELMGQSSSTTAGGASTFECDYSSGQNASPFTANGGNFQMLMWRNATTSIQSFLIVVEREKDNTGADTNNSVNYIIGYGPSSSASPSGTFRQNNLALSGANPIACTDVIQSSFGGTIASGTHFGVFSLQQVQMSTSGSRAAHSNTAIVPVFGYSGYVTNPLLGLVTAVKGDVVEATSFSISLYGVSHTYLPTKQLWAQNVVETTGVSAFAIRFE